MLLPVTSPSMSGFTALRRAGHLRLPNEAEMSSLALRLTSSPQQGFARRITPPHACRATCRTGNLQGELLSVHKIGQACPGASRVVPKGGTTLHCNTVNSCFLNKKFSLPAPSCATGVPPVPEHGQDGRGTSLVAALPRRATILFGWAFCLRCRFRKLGSLCC